MIVPDSLMLALGAVLFSLIVTDLVLVQPFDGFVTVTVYVPPLLTDILEPVVPVFHL